LLLTNLIVFDSLNSYSCYYIIKSTLISSGYRVKVVSSARNYSSISMKL